MACAVLNCSSAFSRLMLDGIELAENHAVFHALGIERDDLFKFGNGQVERVARRARRKTRSSAPRSTGAGKSSQAAYGRQCRRERS